MAARPILSECATCQKPNIFKYIPSSSNIQNYLLIPPLGVGYRGSLTSPAGALYSAAPVIFFFGGPQADVRPTKKWIHCVLSIFLVGRRPKCGPPKKAGTCEYRILLSFVYFTQYYLGGIARQIARGYAVPVVNLVHGTSPTKFSLI